MLTSVIMSMQTHDDFLAFRYFPTKVFNLRQNELYGVRNI